MIFQYIFVTFSSKTNEKKNKNKNQQRVTYTYRFFPSSIKTTRRNSDKNNKRIYWFQGRLDLQIENIF